MKAGKFYIDRGFIDKAPDDVRLAMGECIIMRAEHLLFSNQVEYYAICEQFRDNPHGRMLPTYSVHIKVNENDEKSVIFQEEI